MSLDAAFDAAAAVETAAVANVVAVADPLDRLAYWGYGGSLMEHAFDDTNICLLGCFCPCILFGQIVEQVANFHTHSN